MPPPSPQRRPVDLASLEQHTAKVKLRTAVLLPEVRRRTVSFPRESFVPVVQAEVGALLPLLVYRYRILVPIGQLDWESADVVRRVRIATNTDVAVLRNTFIRHFGGVTLLHQPPASASGVGARDPEDIAGTLEENEHIAFEVYAAPVQESDEYFLRRSPRITRGAR